MKIPAVVLLSCFFLEGCCLKKVGISPTATLTGGVVGTASVVIVVEFEDCLRGAEKQIVLEVKKSVAQALHDLRDNKITLDDYNKFLDSARRALVEIQRVAKPGTSAGFGGAERAEAFARAHIVAAGRPR